MMRRALSALVVGGLGLGLGALPGGGPARAASGPQITNLSVATSGTTAQYSLCVLSSSPPLQGGVAIAGPGGPLNAGASTNGGCGSNTYLLQATFANLAAGAYTFQSACVYDGSGIPDCKDPGTPLVGNLYGETVGNQCQVNFSIPSQLAPRNCAFPHSGGVVGNISGGSPPPSPPTATPLPPTATNTPVPPTATNTPVPPTATATAVPATATNTPVPPTATSTAVPATATNTSVPPTATATAVPPTATSTSIAVNTATPTPTPRPICKPGHGYGDKNHCHSGPPGQNKPRGHSSAPAHHKTS